MSFTYRSEVVLSVASPSKRACHASRTTDETPVHVQHDGDPERTQPATASAGVAGGGAWATGGGLRPQRSCYDLRLLDLQHQCQQQGLVPAAAVSGTTGSVAQIFRHESCDKSTLPQAPHSCRVQQTALDLSHLSLSKHGPLPAVAATTELARGSFCLHSARSAGGDPEGGVDAVGRSASLSSAQTRVHMAIGAGLSANSSASAMTGLSTDSLSSAETRVHLAIEGGGSTCHSSPTRCRWGAGLSANSSASAMTGLSTKTSSSSAVSPCASIASSSSSSFCTLN